MTREEQIKKAAKEYVKGEPEGEQKIIAMVGFEFGAKWADEHPDGSQKFLDRACKWIRENLDRYDESIGLTKEEFIKEFLEFINEEL